MSQSEQHKVVILEKNQSRRDLIKSIVSGRGDLPFIFEKETICLDNLDSLKPDLVISGPLASNRTFRFVNTVKMMDGSLPVLIISGDQSIRDFANSNGYRNVKVLKKNFEPTEIKNVISRLINSRYVSPSSGAQADPLIIGNTSAMIKIKKRINELKSLNEPILIQGEPGTGKELIARAIHHQSDKINQPFTKVNMREMNSQLLNDIIFRVGKGGFVEQASSDSSKSGFMVGGTLFMDEIGALSAPDQSRLLAIFEDGAFSKSSNRSGNTNASGTAFIISSTGLLERLVKKGKFRKDLFYRISVIYIKIPPLRDRIDDIPLLTDFFADKFCQEYSAGHIELPKKIKDSFCSYPWPGNVRELKSIVRRSILYGEKDYILQKLTAQWNQKPNSLSSHDEIYALAGLSNLENYLQEQENPALKSIRNVFLLRTEKAVIKKALEKTNWNRKKAAKLLEISYKSMLNKIKEYKLG